MLRVKPEDITVQPPIYRDDPYVVQAKVECSAVMTVTSRAAEDGMLNVARQDAARTVHDQIYGDVAKTVVDLMKTVRDRTPWDQEIQERFASLIQSLRYSDA